MSFFKDFKEDLSQAVNELLPEEAPVEEFEEPEMVDTITEEETIPESLEGLLSGIDELGQTEENLPVEALVQEAEEAQSVAEEAQSVADEAQMSSYVNDFADEEAEPELETKLEMELEPEIEPESDAIEEVAAEEAVDEEQSMESVDDMDADAAAEDYAAAETEDHIAAETEIKLPEFTEEEEMIPEDIPLAAQAETVQKMAVEETAEIKEEKVENKMNTELKNSLGDEPATDENSVITEGMTINGDIISRGSMDVLGTITGNIEIKGKLNISGTINGNSKAAEIFADSAKINGEVVSEGSVKVGQSSVIVGNITALSAVIAGAVKGDIDVHGPVILDTSAIVMGDIKSKSVQINNGAVIEGHCSQCYADVSPTSFFSDIK